MAGWTIRELVGHATGSAAKIVALLEGAEIWRTASQPEDWITDEPVARLRELSATMRRALPGADFDALRPSPAGDVPLRSALGFPVADLALHSWDVHRSQGRLIELPGEVLMLTRALLGSLPEDSLRRPGAFGPAQPAPDDATPTFPRAFGLIGQREADFEPGPGRQVVRRQRATVGLHQTGRDGQAQA